MPRLSWVRAWETVQAPTVLNDISGLFIAGSASVPYTLVNVRLHPFPSPPSPFYLFAVVRRRRRSSIMSTSLPLPIVPSLRGKFSLTSPTFSSHHHTGRCCNPIVDEGKFARHVVLFSFFFLILHLDQMVASSISAVKL